MFGSQILEVAIGVVFVYILVSIICSAIREGIEGFLKTRAAYLEKGIRELLHDPDAAGLAQQVYRHPLINSLFAGDYVPSSVKELGSKFARGGNLPSYIPSKNFAVALMDLAARGVSTNEFNSAPNAPPITLDTIRTNVGNISNPSVQRVLLSAIDSAQGDIDKAQKAIEDWYDSAMDRVSGGYKRATGKILFLIAAVLVLALNIDTIAISDYLYRNDTARLALVNEAQTLTSTNISAGAAKKQLDAANIPIGWNGHWIFVNPLRDSWGFFAPILGWLLTAFAAMLGAPFWFDVLNKIMVIRSTVKPHEKSPEEASEDRQIAAPPPVLQAPPPQVAPPAPQAPAPPAPPPPSAPHDDVDGCDVKPDPANATSDEDLPAAQGGVAA